MADNSPNNPNPAKPQNSTLSEERLRYIGFDVGPKKIGNLYSAEAEERKFIDHVVDKRQHNDVFRDTSNFREERISLSEQRGLLVASVIVILSVFLPFTPWISGYVQTETEVSMADSGNSIPETPVVTSVITDGDGDVSVNADAEETSNETTDGAVDESVDTPDDSDNEAAAATTAASEAPSKPREYGFQDLEVAQSKTKITKTPYSVSGIGIFANLGELSGKVFSSGIVLIISGLLLIVYMLLCLGIPGYIIYNLTTLKGNIDEVALKLKAVLKLAWIPVLIWAALIALSIPGAEYGFDTAGALKQVGESYSIGALMGLLGSGFYISLAGFIMAGAKSVEI